MERIPRPGEFYRHFKNKLYQIVAVAEHTETGEPLVVYQALYGDFRIYARPLAMFTGRVDMEKYPDVTQEYRFEKVSFETEEQKNYGADCELEETAQEADSYFMAFLDAEDHEKRMEALAHMKGRAGQKEIDSICLVMDIPKKNGSIEEQILEIERHLVMRYRYDGSRLR